jgi:hypothetical protein
MATYPAFAITDLASFSGRTTAEYTNLGYVASAINQAVLLFQLGTCLEEWPDSPREAMLAKMAVLSMADAIYLAQPWQTVLSNPFSSETIGSYSYSKVSGAVLSGLPTGISWFDLAVNKLSRCSLDSGIPSGGGIEVFEHDGVFGDGVHENNTRLLGPVNLDGTPLYHDPSEGYRYTAD